MLQAVAFFRGCFYHPVLILVCFKFTSGSMCTFYNPEPNKVFFCDENALESYYYFQNLAESLESEKILQNLAESLRIHRNF